jgi:hypothetical protein
MPESLTPQPAPLNKEEFTTAVTALMRLVARSRASSLTFSSAEVVTFLNHLYEYVAGLHAAGAVDSEQLTRALLATRGKYASVQDRAVAIKALL